MTDSDREIERKAEKMNAKIGPKIKSHIEIAQINQQMAQELLAAAREYENKPPDKWHYDLNRMEWTPISEGKKK